MFKNYAKSRKQSINDLKGFKAIWTNKITSAYLIAMLIIAASYIVSLYFRMSEWVNFMIMILMLAITCYFVVKGDRYIIDKSNSDIEKLDKEYEQIRIRLLLY